MRMNGIDVSSFNGHIDWQRVKDSGIEFAILRVGYGMFEDQKDSEFEYNYSECRRVGMPVGVYLYSYAQSVEDARREADVALRWLDNRKLDLPVYYDLEDRSQTHLGKATLDEMCRTFCDTIEKGKYWAGIYTNKYWATTIISGPELGKRYTYWIAEYNTENTYDGPYVMWQYTSRGRVDGISTTVDLDYLYRDLIAEIDKTRSKNDVTYQVYDNVKREWLPNVTNLDGYAGNYGNPISGLYASPSKGRIVYRVHQKAGSWLPSVVNREDYAGNLGYPIDGLQMESTVGTIYYRVHTKNGSWLPWVNKWDDTADGYAGIYGREIDAVQMYIKE